MSIVWMAPAKHKPDAELMADLREAQKAAKWATEVVRRLQNELKDAISIEDQCHSAAQKAKQAIVDAAR